MFQQNKRCRRVHCFVSPGEGHSVCGAGIILFYQSSRCYSEATHSCLGDDCDASDLAPTDCWQAGVMLKRPDASRPSQRISPLNTSLGYMSAIVGGVAFIVFVGCASVSLADSKMLWSRRW